MIADLAKLTTAIEQVTTNGTLEQRVASLLEQITETLKAKGEYILTDERGRSYRITAAPAKKQEK